MTVDNCPYLRGGERLNRNVIRANGGKDERGVMAQFAKAVGVQRSTVTRWIRGEVRPNQETLKQLQTT
jgi:transcriptional regulator with XRE-family HTH domain